MSNEMEVSKEVNQNHMSTGTGHDIATTKAAQEVQAAMVIAKKFPRNVIAAEGRIMQACKRKGLAESAIYAYPRGGAQVTGPSIRLAETLAQNWGNIDFGIIELEQGNGESQIMAYAWDLESNSRSTKVFTVKHERSARGQIKKLTDPRDIYEMVANQGARRLRACILATIPGDIIESAVEACDLTLKGNNDEPIKDRITKMLSRFEEVGVTTEMIEARIQKNIEALLPIDVVGLGKIYKSLKDGMSKKEEWFDTAKMKAPEMKEPKKPKAKPKPKTPAVTPPKKEEVKEPETDAGVSAINESLQGPLGAEAAQPEDELSLEGEIGPSKLEQLYDMLYSNDPKLSPEQLETWAATKKLNMDKDADVQKVINAFDTVKTHIANS